LIDPFVAVQTANDSDVHGDSMGLPYSCLLRRLLRQCINSIELIYFVMTQRQA
jgi:hypothetical protein